jgi:hypothetical protein
VSCWDSGAADVSRACESVLTAGNSMPCGQKRPMCFRSIDDVFAGDPIPENNVLHFEAASTSSFHPAKSCHVTTMKDVWSSVLWLTITGGCPPCKLTGGLCVVLVVQLKTDEKSDALKRKRNWRFCMVQVWCIFCISQRLCILM